MIAHQWPELAAGVLAAVMLLACAPAVPGPPSGAAPAAPEAATAPQPKRGGVLQTALIKGGATLHPHRGDEQEIVRHTGPAYETLVSFEYGPGRDYRESFEILPWLAQSWEQTDDLTYVFKTRSSVRWHDGAEFTADDVVFTYEWLRQEKALASNRLVGVDTVEKLDRQSVKIVLKQPAPEFLQQLADKNLLIIPKHVVERGDDLNKVIVGTGPFTLRSFRSGVESVWQRNGDYWQPGRPYMDGLRQYWGLEESGMLSAFIAGENDLFGARDTIQGEIVRRGVPSAGVQIKGADNGIGLLMKLDRPPFDDARVRRAVHLGVDRAAMSDALAGGKGLYVTPGIWPGRRWAIPQEELRKMPGFRIPKEQDLGEARRLLAEAGYPQGLSFEVIFNSGAGSSPRMAEVMSAQLRAIGVAVTLKPVESATWTRADRQTGDWGAAANLPTLVNSQFRGLYERFHSKGNQNKTGLNDPKLDQLIEGTLFGKDNDARGRAARRLQEYFLEQVYYIPAIELVTVDLWQPWAHDRPFSPSTTTSLYQDTYSQMWLDVEAMPASRR